MLLTMLSFFASLFDGAASLLRRPVPLFAKRIRCAVLALFALAVSFWGIYEGVRIPSVNRVEIVCPGLPAAFDGYRIVHLSDLHCSTAARRGRFEKIVERVNALKPDLVAIESELDNEFAEFSEDAYKFLERARSAKCCEIEAIHNEGEALQTRGREIRERVAFINAKAKHDKEVKKCAIRAIIFTVITAVSSIYFITNFKKVYRYVSGLPSFYKLSLEFLIFMLLLGGIIGILTFWDLFYEEMNDELFMRKKKEFMNKYKK